MSPFVLRGFRMITKMKSSEFKCVGCNKDFSKRCLQKHIRISRLKKSVKCKMCEASFTIKCLLKKHLSSEHADKMYKCNDCGKSYTEEGNLNFHIMKKHGGNPRKRLKCKVCNVNFKKKAKLKRTHSLGS